MKKLAVLRDSVNEKCPFGLPIPFGCKCVGELIERMSPEESSFENNENILLLDNVGEQCPYANSILEDNEMVECHYDEGDTGLNPSPFYRKVLDDAPTMSGLNTPPIGYYADNNFQGSTYYGIDTVQASKK